MSGAAQGAGPVDEHRLWRSENPMTSRDTGAKRPGVSRRDFLRSAAAAGASLAIAPRVFAGEGAGKPADLNVALIGVGSQGRILMMSGLKIPGIRFKAICDIWSYSQTYGENVLKKFDQPVNVYVDYREMLEKEKGLDAVLVATPDWVHAEQTVACLEAGLHVYCEKEMSNTLESAAAMVRAARETGRLLQVGHQRRSNPRYLHAERLVHKDKILGRVTHVYGQWNRPQRLILGWPKKYPIDDETLKRFGYGTMEQFRNWRWYKKYSGGPIADLGSHQVDVFNWFLGTAPSDVVADGGLDYYEDGEWYDNILATYAWRTADGVARGVYEVLSTTSFGGYYETFMGDEGTLVLSEDVRKGYFVREMTAKKREWEDDAEKVEKMGTEAIELKIGETRRATGEASEKSLKAEADLEKPVHQPHLENFFDAVRNGTALTCPGEVGYETAVSVLRVNEAVGTGRRIQFKPEDFKV